MWYIDGLYCKPDARGIHCSSGCSLQFDSARTGLGQAKAQANRCNTLYSLNFQGLQIDRQTYKKASIFYQEVHLSLLSYPVKGLRTRLGLYVIGLVIWSLHIVSITSQELQVVTICYIRVTRDGDIVTSEFSPGHVSVSGHWPDWPRNSCHIFTSFRFSSCSLTARGNKMVISQFQFSSLQHFNFADL